nr:hypothetical protein [Neisseria bergeri]
MGALWYLAKYGHRTAYAALNRDTPQAVRRRLPTAGDDELCDFAAQDPAAAYGAGFRQHVSHADVTVRRRGMSPVV